MTFEVKKILVPVAFTENCLKAKDFAADIAKRFDAEIELLHVVEASPYLVYQQTGILKDVPLYEMPGGTMPSANQKYIIRDVLEETRNELEKIASESANGVKFVTEVKHGHSVDEILRAIDEYKPDLVVMATHGRRGLRQLLLGSVTEKVVRLSSVPVLTFRV